MHGHDKVTSRAKSLGILAFSDYHVQSLTELPEFVAGRKPDLILYGGDAVHRFHEVARSSTTMRSGLPSRLRSPTTSW
jgi:hypothetical protein